MADTGINPSVVYKKRTDVCRHTNFQVGFELYQIQRADSIKNIKANVCVKFPWFLEYRNGWGWGFHLCTRRCQEEADPQSDRSASPGWSAGHFQSCSPGWSPSASAQKCLDNISTGEEEKLWKSKFTSDFQLHISPSTAEPPSMLECQRLEVKPFFIRSGRVNNNRLVDPSSSCSFPLETVSIVDIRPRLPTEQSQTFRLVALNDVYTGEYF